jgi:hypothetical protein
MSSKQPVVNLPSLYANGLNIAWASNTTLTVSAGICRDSSNTFDMTLSSAATINAAVNGANGLDTGTLAASTVYAVLLVSDSAGYNSPVALLSLSATAPTLPTGYDIFRRIGWAITDSGTHFLLIYQSGSGATRIYTYDEPQVILSGGSATSFTAVSLVAFAPVVDNLPVCIQAAFTPSVADDAANLRSGGSSATTGCLITGQVAAKRTISQIHLDAKTVSSAPKVEYKVAASGALTADLVSFVDFV